jgi:hypothetical protein
MRKLIFILILLSTFMVSFSQQTGKLSGKVTDAETGESLPGVNVIIKGTYYGAATNIDGNFTINNISVGKYNVDISLIGYKTYKFTGVEIEANKTRQLDIKLEETVLTLTSLPGWR